MGLLNVVGGRYVMMNVTSVKAEDWLKYLQVTELQLQGSNSKLPVFIH